MTFDPETATARETLCRLLAACYYEPAVEFGEERVFEAMREAAAHLDRELADAADRLARAFDAVPLDDLLLDYARLFLGPNRMLAKPYGSAWIEGEKSLMQDSTMAVLALYREGGFDLAEDFREMPDHVAAELEFLYLLIFRENRARQDGDQAALAAALDLRRRFLDAHLGRWIAPFAAAVKDGAQTDFYGALADLTACYVVMDARTNATRSATEASGSGTSS